MGWDSEFRIRYQTGYPLEGFAREKSIEQYMRSDSKSEVGSEFFEEEYLVVYNVGQWNSFQIPRRILRQKKSATCTAFHPSFL